MTIKEQLMTDMKEAMKARDQERLTTIRFLMAEIKNAEIDGASEDDANAQKVIASQVKKLKDAMADFKAAGREDLLPAEEAKIAIMEKYLPEQMSDEELKTIVEEVLANAGDTSNQGQLIGQVIKKTAGQADGGRVSAMIRELTTN